MTELQCCDSADTCAEKYRGRRGGDRNIKAGAGLVSCRYILSYSLFSSCGREGLEGKKLLKKTPEV